MANPYLEYKKKKEKKNPYLEFKEKISNQETTNIVDKYEKEYSKEKYANDDNVLPGIVGKVFDVLQRGQYASANLANEIVDVFQGEEFNPVQAVREGITGEVKGSFADVVDRIPRITEEPEQYASSLDYDYTKPWETIKRMFSDTFSQAPARAENLVRGTAGLAGDIFLDPLNYIGIGVLGKAGRVASKLDDVVKSVKIAENVSDLSKLDDPIKAILKAANIDEGSKLARKITEVANKYGVDALDLGKDAVQQAQKGQRGLLNFAGKPILPTEVSETTFKWLNNLGEAAKGTEAYQFLARLFDSKYGVPDEIIDMEKARDIKLNVRKQEVIDKAKNYKSLVDDLGIEGNKLTELIEKGKNIEDAKVGDVVNFFIKENENLLQLERATGIPVEQLQSEKVNYFAHMLTEEARDKILKKYKGSSRSKLREILDNIEHGSTKTRTFKDMSIAEINDLARKGELPGFKDIKFNKFFEDDPVIAQSLRNLRSARARTDAEFFQEIADKFGSSKNGESIYKYVEQHNPKLASFVKGKKFDPEIADYLVRYAEKTTPENLNAFVKAFDKLQNLWKRTTLMPIPGFHVRNMFDNAWKNYLGDVSLSSYDDWVRLRNTGEIVTDAGKKITKDQFDDLAVKYGIVDTGFLMSNVSEALEKELRKGDNVLTKAGDVLRQAGAWNENTFRQIHFLDKLKKGYSPDKAAESVAKFLFDYNDLTDFEKKYMKRFFPFYSFTRKNIPLQLEMLVTQPGKLTKIPKTMNAVENLNDEEVDETYLPDWIKNSASVRLPLGEDPSYFLLDNWISSVDLLNFTSPQEAGNTALNMITPFVKTIAELITNYDFFTREPVSEYKGESTEYLGFPINNYLLKATDMSPISLRLLDEINRLNPGNIFGDDKQRPFQGEPSERWIRALTGLKSYDYDPEASAFYQQLENKKIYQDMLNDLRKAYNRGDERMANKLEELLRQFIEENS